jgi:N-sulfoglucosamine sulfohydrolase
MNLTPNAPYYIKYMMNPENKASYWNNWVEKAKTSAETKKLVDRITTRPALEFYDIQKDPYELNNLAAQKGYEKLVKQYEVKLKEWMNAQGDQGAAGDRVYQKGNKAAEQ